MSSARAFSYMHLAHIEMIEKLHSQFLQDPMSVEPSWRYFFEGVEFGEYQKIKASPQASSDERVYHLINVYRTFGHLSAHINPIATRPPEIVEELKLSSLNFKENELNAPFPTCGLLSEPTAPYPKSSLCCKRPIVEPKG